MIRLRRLLAGICLAATMLGGCTASTTQGRPQDKALVVSAYEETISMADGRALPMRVWHTKDPQRIILGIHGFNDYSKAFVPLAQMARESLHAQVYAYDQRGFGANNDTGQWPGDQQLIDDIRWVTQQIRQRHPALPLIVIGESMGGALVLRAASEPGGLSADGLVLLAPAVWGMQIMPWYQRWGLEMLNTLAPDMTFTGRGIQHLGIRPTDDPKVSRDLSEDPLFIKETRVSSLYGISQLMDKALAHPMHFPLPTLVLYGLNDRIIPPAPTCTWLSRLSRNVDSVPAHVRFVVYPEGWHMLTRQTRAAEVSDDLRDWLINFNRSQQGISSAASALAGAPQDLSPSLKPAQQAVCQRAGRFP